VSSRVATSWPAPLVPDRSRRPYLDNLKVVLVAGVIVAHAFITYGDIGSWPYRDISESDAFNIVAALAVGLGSLFAMGLFFLIAGVLTPGPLARKGPSGFVRDRVLRLGVPFAAYVVLVTPLLELAADDAPSSFSSSLAALDAGPLWFAGALLLFSVAFVGWRSARPHPPARAPVGARDLVHLAIGIAAASFAVRLVFPMNSEQVFMIHVWQWPQCIGLFALGIRAAERGGLDPVPTAIRRGAGWAAVAGALLTVVAFAVSHDSIDPYAGGLTWQAAVTVVSEGVAAVGFSVWLLGRFQARHDRTSPLRAALGRSAFGAYVLQAPVLVAIALALDGWNVAPEVRFLVLAPLGVAASFALSWLLTRLPGVRHVL
jgi:fucose 4-O-acetylase-like acetyltransferase